MLSPSGFDPCPCFPVPVLFPDVGPDELEREAEDEASRGWQPDAWYLNCAIPALERHASRDMARALLEAGTAADPSRAHAEQMRRRAVAAGAMRRARFWAEVAEEIGPSARD